MRFSTAFIGLAYLSANLWGGEIVTPAEYLAQQPRPVFRAGHTLLPLTRYGWTLAYETRVELTEHWGYALEFGGYTTEQLAAKMDDPKSVESKLVALTASDPEKYPLVLICARDLPKDCPDATWTRTADGKFIGGKGEVFEPTHEGKQTARIWSPEAPNSVFVEAGRLRADPIAKIRARAPVALILNGGEYAMSVPGHHAKLWEKDPSILKAKGERGWFEYVSEQKARHEMLIARAVRETVPERLAYIYYPCGGGTHRNRNAGWNTWCWGYEWMQSVSDFPSNETYYKHFNSGFSGKEDMLTMALNAKGFELQLGRPLSYNWLCAGWPRGDAGDKGLADIARYTGYLKCFYATGMLGGNAGYYDFPKGGFDAKFPADQPPHWLQQMMAFGRVHALFSHLEEYLRHGYLLPGPEKHRWSKEQPAYEFPTGSPDIRVIARKMNYEPRWLIAAWAADGPEKEVDVTIPELGEVKLLARPCGTVYCVALKDGKATIEMQDGK